MSSFVAVVVLSLSAVCASSVSAEAYSGSLRLVNVVFRHGQRTPADTYPNDPHINFQFEPFGWGQLTKEGKLQQFQLGQYLRKRYGEFLGPGYDSKAAHLQSTGVDRTLMSAQLTAAGLFPPTAHERWRVGLDWQPVPVHSEPLDEDSLLLVRIPCARYHEALDEVKAMPEVKQRLDSFNALNSALTKHSGLTIANPDDVQSLYSTMLAEAQYNLTLPEWTRDYFPKEMAAVTAYSFTLNAYNDELKRLKGGPLLKKVLGDMEAKAKDPKKRNKISIYAGHDSTVANFMSALKVWEEQIPTYNIMAMIELREVNNVNVVKIFLRNSTDHEPYLLKVPGCEALCPLTKLVELSKSVLPSDLQKECESKDPNYKQPPPSGP